MNAKKAVELGFADEILYQDKKEPDEDPKEDPDDPKEDPDNLDSDGPDENDPDKKKKVIIPGAEAHMIIDMYVESQNDEYKYPDLAGQDDFDKF